MAAHRGPQAEESRARILDAARRLFRAHGADEVTMADVAREAGDARATVFNHFGSKHALVEAITESVFGGYQALLEGALADRETPAPALVRFLFEQMGKGIEEDRRFYRAVFREIAKIAVGLEEGGIAQHARGAAIEILVQLLTRGQARGELSRDFEPEDLASVFDSLVFGTITHWLYDDASEPLPSRMLRAAEVFLGAVAVGGPAEPRRRSPEKRASRRSAAPLARSKRRRR